MLALQVEGIPTIAPGRSQHTAVEFRAVLRVEHERSNTLCVHRTPETAREEREHELRKVQVDLGAVFNIVLIRVALQTFDGLKGASQLQREHCRAAEEIAVLIAHADSRAEVACRVGSFHFRRHAMALRHDDTDVSIQRIRCCR